MAIKCVIWDLDQTIWEGILLEGDELQLRPRILETIQTLDSWGILHSIASHNDESLALQALESFGLKEFFLVPQINFNPKPEQIASISQALDLRMEDIAFVDDDAFQRAQVAALLPVVTTLTPQGGVALTGLPGLRPDRLTLEGSRRREFYRSRIARSAAEAGFTGSRLEFLKSCKLRLELRIARKDDIHRIDELIQRTNQLNATAQRYDFTEVQDWLENPWIEIRVGELTDRFGDYGLVGVATLQKRPVPWIIRLLLVSCRAMGRGVGEGLLVHALRLAARENQPVLHILYRKTPYNQAMRLLFATHGFRPVQKVASLEMAAGDPIIFQYDLHGDVPDYPAWLEVIES
jgi:FkbH-like protein